MHDGGGGYHGGGHDGGHPNDGGHHHAGNSPVPDPADGGPQPFRHNSNYRYLGTVLFLAALAMIFLTVLVHR
jgi:hypothetical protein